MSLCTFRLTLPSVYDWPSIATSITILSLSCQKEDIQLLCDLDQTFSNAKSNMYRNPSMPLNSWLPHRNSLGFCTVLLQHSRTWFQDEKRGKQIANQVIRQINECKGWKEQFSIEC
jgi:hypothetical protein